MPLRPRSRRAGPLVDATSRATGRTARSSRRRDHPDLFPVGRVVGQEMPVDGDPPVIGQPAGQAHRWRPGAVRPGRDVVDRGGIPANARTSASSWTTLPRRMLAYSVPKRSAAAAPKGDPAEFRGLVGQHRPGRFRDIDRGGQQMGVAQLRLGGRMQHGDLDRARRPGKPGQWPSGGRGRRLGRTASCTRPGLRTGSASSFPAIRRLLPRCTPAASRRTRPDLDPARP